MNKKKVGKKLARYVRHRSSEEILTRFGSFIAHRRLARGLTSREFASKLGVSQSMVSRIEAGEREPRLDLLRRLNVAIGIEDAITQYLRDGSFPLPDGHEVEVVPHN